jgi:hypothetical protein
MFDIDASWEKEVPADLHLAVENLRDSFENDVCACKLTTAAFCYALLHNESVYGIEKQYRDYFLQLRFSLYAAPALKFDRLLETNTPPSTFQAFSDLYLAGVSARSLIAFAHLVEIGRANEARLDVPPLNWAKSQVKHMISSIKASVDTWITNVCDKPSYSSSEDDEEIIFRRKWQAPRLLRMKPAGHLPYEPARAWERLDAERSWRLRQAFAQNFELELVIRLNQHTGREALQLAKLPRVPRTPVVDSLERKNGATTKAPGNVSTDARRQARKLKKQKERRVWQKAYLVWKKSNPGMSDVW